MRKNERLLKKGWRLAGEIHDNHKHSWDPDPRYELFHCETSWNKWKDARRGWKQIQQDWWKVQRYGKKVMDLDKKYENQSDDDRNRNVIANQSETVMAGLHNETTESEVTNTLKEMMKEIGRNSRKLNLFVLPNQSLMPSYISRTTTKGTSSSDRQTCEKKELRGRKIRNNEIDGSRRKILQQKNRIR